MKTGNSRARLAVLPLAVAAAFSSTFGFAQSAENATTLQQVVVTATRVAQPLSELVADVTVIDRAQIERSGALGIADLLSRVPGFEMVRNGGPGTATNLFIRGAETRHTAVYIDGVRVDSQTTSGGATWETIPLSQIDRIEVLRGPAGAVYGSNAMGGVIQLFTRKSLGGFSPYVALGLGTYATTKLEIGFTGSSGPWDYALGLADDYSRGFNARPDAGYNADDDGFHSQSGSLRVGMKLDSVNRLEASMLSNDLHSQYDSSSKVPVSSQDDQNLRLLQASSLRWLAKWNPVYSTTLSVTESLDRYETTPSPYLTTTRLRGYLFQNELRLGKNLLTATLERNEDQFSNTSTTPKDNSRSQDAVALGYGWTSALHSVQANVRRDQDSEFGGQTNGALSYGYELHEGWRATASAGTAFRAPTLYQRFSSSGLSTLQPETSRNLELGLRYAMGGGSVGVTVYKNNVANLVSFLKGSGPCANGQTSVKLSDRGCYGNVAEAVYRGITLTTEQPLAGYTLRGSLDLQDPRDASTGNLLPRRTTHHGVLGLDTTVDAWSLGVELQASAMRFDNATNTTALPGYVSLNLNGQRQIAKDWTLLLRLDNATDAVYQLINGYATAGRTLYAGMRWAP